MSNTLAVDVRSTVMGALGHASDAVGAATVLVVEDNEAVARAVVRVGESRGFRMVVAKDGRRALEVHAAERPDVMLLDINLPQMDGRDVFAHLKKEDLLGNTLVIFGTDRDDQIDRIAGLQMGAIEYLAKPYDLALLFNRIERLLEKRDAGLL